MRCKNCGSQNEDGRYICQNCGSPLYDETEDLPENEQYDADYDDYDDEYDRKNTKKSIIIIVVLAVVLITIIAGIVFAVSHFGAGENETENQSSISTSENITQSIGQTQKMTEKTTESTTQTTTTITTTETTTKKTTTTTEAKFRVSVDIDGNGSVSGDGEYAAGKRVSLVATADAGAQFIGWYDNGTLVASGNKYSFTVNANRNLTAVFQKTAEVETSNEQQTQPQQ